MDQPIPLTPSNRLEEVLVSAKQGKIGMREFLRVLLDSDVVVGSATEIRADGSGLTPLLFDKEGTSMVAVFTSLERVTRFKEMAHYALSIKARTFLTGLSRDVGIVINPGFTEGLDVTPEGIKKILNDFRAP